VGVSREVGGFVDCSGQVALPRAAGLKAVVGGFLCDQSEQVRMLIQLFVICADNEGVFGISRREGVEEAKWRKKEMRRSKGKRRKALVAPHDTTTHTT
jgi:hypothetical protein